MHANKIKRTFLNWLENYTAERRQAVVLHGSTSDYADYAVGVPQGNI